MSPGVRVGICLCYCVLTFCSHYHDVISVFFKQGSRVLFGVFTGRELYQGVRLIHCLFCTRVEFLRWLFHFNCRRPCSPLRNAVSYFLLSSNQRVAKDSVLRPYVGESIAFLTVRARRERRRVLGSGVFFPLLWELRKLINGVRIWSFVTSDLSRQFCRFRFRVLMLSVLLLTIFHVCPVP